MKKTRNKKSGLVAIGSEAKGWEYRKSWGANWDDGGKGLTLGTNFWSGSGGLNDLNQRTGLLGLHSGDFSFAMTNDAWFGGDKYRTAAAEVGVGDYSFGLNLYTSEPPTEEYRSELFLYPL
ncbi:MAG: hypothetical protein CVT96_03765 [Bacteroidetes bacterium HGW-Bacteroidetes-13]|nr:MAG: hypothetical protein CVT96_03765 [Bacteroidetes bacterium HGW-Bacteroidetes-13]